MSRQQLLATGVAPSVVQRRVASGHLVPLHRGVYAVGHRRLTRKGFCLGAVLAAGPGAVLSHRSAATLHELLPAVDGIHVSTAGQRRVPAIGVHTRRLLEAADVTEIDAIPVTTIARTLLDLAGTVRREQLVKAISEAERRQRFDLHAIEAAMERAWGRRGRSHQALREALREVAEHGPTITRSELEDRFLVLLDVHRIERPLVNARVLGMEVDAFWPAAKLVVELDGYEHHRGRSAFQRDRERANALEAAGYRMLRFTYADVERRDARVAELVRAMLSPAS